MLNKKNFSPNILGAIMPPKFPRTHFIAQLSVLAANLLLVSTSMDDQAATEHCGETIAGHLSRMSDEIRDMAETVKKEMNK